MSFRKGMLWAASIVTVMLVTCAAFLPSTWVGNVIAEHSRLRLLHPDGTLWSGSAILAVSDGRSARMLPGRLAWRVHPVDLFRGRISFNMIHPSFQDSIDLSYDGSEALVNAGHVTWPASLLEILGAPFNTISPGGDLRVRWGALRMSDDQLDGRIQVDWTQAQSAMSPIVPLGDFRVVILAADGQGTLELMTLQGPLLLEGRGELAQGVIRFSGTADAEPDMRAQLNGLIGVLGPRSGQKVLLKWEMRT